MKAYKVILLSSLLVLSTHLYQLYLNKVDSQPDLSEFVVPPAKYSFSLDSATYGGYHRAVIADIEQYYYPDFKIKDVEYYADEILIKKITNKEAKNRHYEFILANPEKRLKLHPIKHKWVINSTHGLLTKEITLFVFGKESGNYTFIKGLDIEPKDVSTEYSRFRFRNAPNKQSPVVAAISGLITIKGKSVDFYQLNAIDNGRVIKTEYYIDEKLIQTYTGDYPHCFEAINPERKSPGSKLKILFKVYDDEGNVTQIPKEATIEEITRTELHDERWMYIKKQEE